VGRDQRGIDAMPKRIRPLVVTFLVVTVYCGSCTIAMLSSKPEPVDCELLAVSTPDPPPVYPGSTLLEQPNIADSEHMVRYRLYYEVLAPPEEVVEYYSALEFGCESQMNDAICRRYAETFGYYQVFIDQDSPTKTQYTIIVSMSRCGPRSAW
jgi:hypothetical protein